MVCSVGARSLIVGPAAREWEQEQDRAVPRVATLGSARAVATRVPEEATRGRADREGQGSGDRCIRPAPHRPADRAAPGVRQGPDQDLRDRAGDQALVRHVLALVRGPVVRQGPVG